MQTDKSDQRINPCDDSVFESQVKEMQRTQKMISKLETKLNGFFRERKESESHSRGISKSNKSLPMEKVEKLETRMTSYQSKEINPERGGHLMKENVDFNQMESYYKHKNQLIEKKLKQLQRDLEIDEQEKMSLYKNNEMLQNTLKQLKGSQQTRENSLKKEESLQKCPEIIDLLHKLAVQKKKNRKLRDKVQLLKQNYTTIKSIKTTQASVSGSPDKKYHSIKTQIEQLRQEIKKQKKNQKQLKKQIIKSEQIKSISCQLKRLKQLILSKSKLKLK